MQVGRCVAKNYGYVGCSADVFGHVASLCSGRSRCRFEVPDETLKRYQPCPKDFASYLEISYVCVPGMCRPTAESSIAAAHDKMRSGADLRGASPLVSFNHVTHPHFAAFSSSLYTTICNPKPNPNPNPNPHPKPNPNRNPTVITDPQIGPRNPQIVTVQIRPAPHYVAYRLRSAIASSPSYLFQVTRKATKAH